MKLYFKILLILFCAGCNNSTNSNTQNEASKQDSEIAKKIPGQDSAVNQRSNDSATIIQYEKQLLDLSSRILKSIKERDYAGLSKFIHPTSGVRFSLYGHIDTVSAQVISAGKLKKLGNNEQKITWGLMDGTGQPVDLSIDGYFKRFVYDADFLNAEKKAVNTFLESGNSLNNLKEVYPGCDFTEFYFSGFDPKYSGMDWRTLRLVFKKYKDKNYLVGIVHDEWTI